jgi:hypothetical protein
MKLIEGAILWGRLLVLPANSRLGLKGLPWTYTLVYYEHSYITDVKRFITLGQVCIIIIHHFMIHCIKNKPLGSKTLFDAAFKDTLWFTCFSGSVFCIIDILSRFEFIRNLCSQNFALLTFTSLMYIFAFVSVCIHNSSLCIIKIACIMNLTFMEETAGETLVRVVSIIFTLSVSISACLLLTYLEDINSGTAMTLFTHQVIPTGNFGFKSGRI